MRSALACLHRRKDKEISHGPKDVTLDTWKSSGKGDGIAPQVNGVRYFSFEELRMYTDNFSESNLIWRVHDGKVYKGYLPNGVIVSIKRTNRKWKNVPEFINEIELLSRVHHKNIVTLVGFCFEHGEQLLVYEYMSKGSLHTMLFDKNCILEWKQRLGIALDLARGLAYLHELVNPQIIHREAKPSNVLLDENLNAKLIDFGISKFGDGKKELDLDFLQGTLGYLAPELMHGELSEKSDVYSFGVVMIALLTGRRCRAGVDEEGEPILLVEKVEMAIDEHNQEYYGLRDLIDPRIMNQARNIGLRNFVQLALACLSHLPSERPSMYEVMKQIEAILQNY